MFLPRGQIFLGTPDSSSPFWPTRAFSSLEGDFRSTFCFQRVSPHHEKSLWQCESVDISLSECQTSSGTITTWSMLEHLVALTHTVTSDYSVSSLRQISVLAHCRGCRGGKGLFFKASYISSMIMSTNNFTWSS